MKLTLSLHTLSLKKLDNSDPNNTALPGYQNVLQHPWEPVGTQVRKNQCYKKNLFIKKEPMGMSANKARLFIDTCGYSIESVIFNGHELNSDRPAKMWSSAWSIPESFRLEQGFVKYGEENEVIVAIKS